MKERNLKFWQIWKVESKVQSINCSIEVQTRQKLRGKNILQSITKWFQYIYKKLQSSIAIFKCKWIILLFFMFINLNSSSIMRKFEETSSICIISLRNIITWIFVNNERESNYYLYNRVYR